MKRLIMLLAAFLMSGFSGAGAPVKPEFSACRMLLQDMLTGKSPLSLKDARYYLEKSWGSGLMSHEDYNKAIRSSSGFIAQWLYENKMDTTDSYDLNYGIYRFLSDTLEITTEAGTRLTHFPFRYDYDDFMGRDDFRNNFVTKALFTGMGQCNSLPLLYLLLAESLGADAWLSFAPFHSFIKFPLKTGEIANYDPTSDMFIPDHVYQDYLHISADAERSKIYLDTVSKKQLIASFMIDLAWFSLLQNNFSDTDFAEECIHNALACFHQGRSNIQAWLILSNIHQVNLQRLMEDHGLQELSRAQEYPDADREYRDYLACESRIMELGYRDIPSLQYDAMMEKYEQKKEKQLTELNNGIKQGYTTDFRKLHK
jgi:hypothetical protein